VFSVSPSPKCSIDVFDQQLNKPDLNRLLFLLHLSKWSSIGRKLTSQGFCKAFIKSENNHEGNHLSPKELNSSLALPAAYFDIVQIASQ
jgi:hypothetical protein